MFSSDLQLLFANLFRCTFATNDGAISSNRYSQLNLLAAKLLPLCFTWKRKERVDNSPRKIGQSRAASSLYPRNTFSRDVDLECFRATFPPSSSRQLRRNVWIGCSMHLHASPLNFMNIVAACRFTIPVMRRAGSLERCSFSRREFANDPVPRPSLASPRRTVLFPWIPEIRRGSRGSSKEIRGCARFFRCLETV